MHLHQPMVWGELNVAKYVKHSKDTDMETRVSGSYKKDGIDLDLEPDQCRLALLLLHRSTGCKY